jgi:hypothetical protein
MQRRSKDEDEAIKRVLSKLKEERAKAELELQRLQARIDGIDYVLRVIRTNDDAMG